MAEQVKTAGDGGSGWSVVEKTDAMTDEVTRIASVTNDIGDSFSLSRIEPGGAVWAVFLLASQNPDCLSSEHLPMLRVDKHKAHDLNELVTQEAAWATLGLPKKLYICEPTQFSYLLWHGADEEGIHKQLGEILCGETLLLRYWLESGQYKETAFAISGGEEIIRQAIESRDTRILTDDELAAR